MEVEGQAVQIYLNGLAFFVLNNYGTMLTFIPPDSLYIIGWEKRLEHYRWERRIL